MVFELVTSAPLLPPGAPWVELVVINAASTSRCPGIHGTRLNPGPLRLLILIICHLASTVRWRSWVGLVGTQFVLCLACQDWLKVDRKVNGVAKSIPCAEQRGAGKSLCPCESAMQNRSRSSAVVSSGGGGGGSRASEPGVVCWIDGLSAALGWISAATCRRRSRSFHGNAVIIWWFRSPEWSETFINVIARYPQKSLEYRGERKPDDHSHLPN